MLGQAKVEVDKIVKRDGKIKIIKRNNNTKENLSIKTNGKEDNKINKRIQDIKENLKIKNLLNSNTKENLNMLSKTRINNTKENLNTLKKNKLTNTKGNPNTKIKKTSIRENHSIKNRKINTKENLNNNSNNSTASNNRVNLKEDHKLAQVLLLQSNTQEIHQVVNHKLHSDILMREI